MKGSDIFLCWVGVILLCAMWYSIGVIGERRRFIKEAYDRGYMIQHVEDYDKVKYRWKEKDEL